MNDDIDFVIPWVDGNDPDWRRRKAEVTSTAYNDDRSIRYRDWGFLRYWFRGVEAYAPWVRYIWFICDQEPPAWLNTKHPKLKIVRHEDYLPAEYRPAFSCNPIELNLHRIEGLAEQFVYFNDDTFLIAPVKKTDFFKHGLPRDCAIINPLMATELATNGRNAHILPLYINLLEYLNCDFNFHSCIKKNPMKWLNPIYGKDLLRNLILLPWPRFIGFIEEHLPNAYLKSSYEEAWKQDYDILDATSKHHIRDDRDVNQWLIRHRQLAEGKFWPRKPRLHCTFAIHEDSVKMHDTIKRQWKQMICLNDFKEIDSFVFLSIQNSIISDFETILSTKSRFEN